MAYTYKNHTNKNITTTSGHVIPKGGKLDVTAATHQKWQKGGQGLEAHLTSGRVTFEKLKAASVAKASAGEAKAAEAKAG